MAFVTPARAAPQRLPGWRMDDYKDLGLTEGEIEALSDKLITLDQAYELFREHFHCSKSTFRHSFRKYVHLKAYSSRSGSRPGRSALLCSKQQVLRAIAEIKLGRKAELPTYKHDGGD